MLDKTRSIRNILRRYISCEGGENGKATVNVVLIFSDGTTCVYGRKIYISEPIKRGCYKTQVVTNSSSNC